MKKVCKQCYYLTGKKGDGKYKCYAGECPAKIKDDKDKNNRTAERIKRVEVKSLKRRINRLQAQLDKLCKGE